MGETSANDNNLECHIFKEVAFHLLIITKCSNNSCRKARMQISDKKFSFKLHDDVNTHPLNS